MDRRNLMNKNIRDKLIDIILKVAMQHHDDISESDEDAACDAADEILNKFHYIKINWYIVENIIIYIIVGSVLIFTKQWIILLLLFFINYQRRQKNEN